MNPSQIIVLMAVVLVAWLVAKAFPLKCVKTTKYDSKQAFKPLQDVPILEEVDICTQKYDETKIVYIVWNNGRVGSEAEYIEYKPIR